MTNTWTSTDSQTARSPKEPVVREVRLSLLWTYTPPFDSTTRLTDRKGYSQAFKDARTGKSPFRLPWIPGRRHHFWEFYLEKSPLKFVDTNVARRHLMPLRLKHVAGLDASLPGVTCNVEGYAFPHGIGVIVNLYVRESMRLDKMVDRLYEVRGTQYQVHWPPDSDATIGKISPEQLAFVAIDQLRKRTVDNTPAESFGNPFSIATIVEAEGAELSETSRQLHQILHGLCSGNKFWRHDKLPPLHSNCLRIQTEHVDTVPATVLYGLKDSRALWFPQYFRDVRGDEVGKIRTLGCYHRNLVLASLQTKNLIGLMRRGADWLNREGPIPGTMDTLPRHAAGILGRLYGGAKESYRTCSVLRQIDRYKHDVNQIRGHFLMPLLTAHQSNSHGGSPD